MDPELLASLGQQMSGAGANLGGALANYFGQNPYDSSLPWYQKIPGMLQGSYGSWMDRGNNAGNILAGQYGQLVNNPGQFINKMGQNFHQSPGFAFQTKQALYNANAAAAAGGMAGSPAEQQNIAGVTNQLANQDYYNWLHNAMGAYQTGLSGYQGQQQLGYNATDQYAQGMDQAYQNIGNQMGGQAQYSNNQNAGLASAIGSFF